MQTELNNLLNGQIDKETIAKVLIGKPTKLIVPSHIYIEVDDRLVDRFDEVLSTLNIEEFLFGKCVVTDGTKPRIHKIKQLSDGTQFVFGYSNKTNHYVFIKTQGESLEERFKHPTTELTLPKKYNEYFAHCWKMAEHTGYCYAYMNNEIPRIKNINE